MPTDPLEVFRRTLDGLANIVGDAQRDAFVKRAWATFGETQLLMHDKRATIKNSGHFAPAGQHTELGALYRGTLAQLHGDRKKIADSLADARKAREADAMLKSTESNDPVRMLIREMRIDRLDAHLRTLDPMELRLRLHTAREAHDDPATAILLDTLFEAGRIGMDILPRAEVQAFAQDLAARADPKVGELATLAECYDDLAMQAITEVKRLAEADRVDVSSLPSTTT